MTNKTGRSKRRGFSLDIDWKALRAKIFLRECVIGAYLLFMGAWLSYNLQAFTLFWFYGIYMWVQGIVYLIFGLSVVDNLNFEPELPEAMRRPYRRALEAAPSKPVAVPKALERVRSSFMDKGGGSPDTRWGASLPRATPLSLAGLKRTTSGLLNRRKPPGVPWEDAMANDLRLNFTNIGAHERVASGGFVGGSRYQKKAESGTPSPPSSSTPPASVTDDPMDGSAGQKTPSPPSSEPAPPEPPPSPPTEPPTAPSPPFEPPYSDDAGSNKSDDGDGAQSVPPPLVTTGSVRDNPFLRRDSKARLDAQSAAAVGKALRARCASPAFGSAVLRSASFPAEMANDDDDDDLNPDAPQPPTLVGGGRSSSGASTHRNLAALRRARGPRRRGRADAEAAASPADADDGAHAGREGSRRP